MTEKPLGHNTIQGRPISLGQASKKYHIPQTTLSDWAARGELTIIRRPQRRGQALLVDESSVVIARENHKRTWEGGYQGVPVQPVLQSNALVPQEKPKYDTAELAEAYHRYGETIGFKPATLEKNRHHLKVFSDQCPVLPTSPQPILDFIHGLPHSMRTKKSYYEVIRAFYNYLSDFNGIQTPLTKRMVPRAERHPYFRVLTREEVLQLFNVAENFQERMLLETLYITRVRASELCSMTSYALYPDYVVVTGKTGTREVPITEDLHDNLAMLGEGFLFKDRNGKQMTKDGVGQRVRKCMERIGLTGKKLSSHTLRHTSLTHLYEDTGDLLLVQEAAGHAELETTMIYTHPKGATQKERLRKHDPISRLGPAHGPTVGKADDAGLAKVLDQNGGD